MPDNAAMSLATRASRSKPASCWLIYGWLWNCSDTNDLKEAKKLLSELV